MMVEEVTDTDSDVEVNRVVIEDGSIVVPDQDAGMSVVLGSVRLPVLAGWIVVRDYMDGVPGNVLGAARFNADEGLMPSSVELMRATEPESTYEVVFYTDDGETGFDLSEDVAIEGIADTFVAR